MAYSYLSLAQLKAGLGESQTTNDAHYRRMLEAASRLIDQATHQRFHPHLATRYFSPAFTDTLVLAPGLLSVTTLKTDLDADQVYEVTWATTDYLLEPQNAVADFGPFTAICRAPLGVNAFPIGPRTVEVAGKWGYVEELAVSPSILTEALDATETAVDVTAGSDFEILQTILVDAEQMYVTGIAANTLTVERGVNGTTAATHALSAAISVYRYPPTLAAALQVQAGRLFRRKETPLGVVGGTDFAAPRGIPMLDPDVKMMLAPLTRWALGMA